MKNLAANLELTCCSRDDGKLATALSVFCLNLVRRGLKVTAYMTSLS